MPMAKEKLHKDDIPVCVKMKKRGLNDKDIAAYLGVRRETFSQWVNHPRTENQINLSNALKKAEADAKAAMLTAIQKAAMEPKTWQAAAWWLERKYPEEFARPEVQLEHRVRGRALGQVAPCRATAHPGQHHAAEGPEGP